jgi:parvulin-like peptidyl-prolyl isomerase
MANTAAVRRPTRKEIDLYYKTHRRQFFAPERVHVFHIVKNVNELTSRDEALAIIQQAQQELAQGAAFSDVARKYSDCGENGGELGWFSRDVMVEEFEDTVFNLAAGETTDVFETRFGLHIAHLVEKRPEEILPLREVYDQIAEQLYRQRLQAAGAAGASCGTEAAVR